MQRIVLDTNCLLQIIPKQSKYRIVWDKILKGEISLCVTTEILNEYYEILSYFLTEKLAENVVNTILNLRKTEKTEVFYFWNLITKDTDDNKFVDCAVSANADLIVTNDKHFKELDKIEFPKVKHVTIQKFFDSL
jgi:putative PIN family toxin of toxin-antitoxin system